MPAITPNTNIRLVKVPLSIDNKNQLTFSNAQDQFNYFNSLQHIDMDNCTYQRKDDVIRFSENFDDLIKYNYCMYQNENYNNKWFYAYIENMRYVNNGMTEIKIKTDVWQTWQFDLSFKQSFIEREMINTSEDTPGSNLLPEGLEIGELKASGTAEFDELEPVNIIAYSGDTIPNPAGGAVALPIQQGGYIANGIAQSVVFIITTNEWYNAIMNNLQKETYSDYIVTCFTVPKLAVSNFMTEDNRLETFTGDVYILENGKNYNQNPTMKTLISTPNNLDGYIPKNQKLRTYPYMYLGFNPSNGNSKIYRYEDFLNGTPTFKIISEVNPNPSVYFIPQNYRGLSGDSLSDLSALNGYPTLSSRNDFYNSWLAQNSNIISLQMQQEQYNYEVGQIKTGANMFGSIFSGLSNPADAGGIISGAMDLGINQVNHDFYVKQQMAQIEKQALLPDKVNLSSSNATLLGYNLMDKNIFTRYTIKYQFAERIDKFFDMYGYLTNKVKIPNLNNRPNWNYVKTIGANITADIPQVDLQEIKNMFDNGLTLWHNTNNFLNYSANNR